LRKRGLLRLAFEHAQLFAGFVELALSCNDGVFNLGMTLLAIGQLHIQLFKARFGLDAALGQLFGLGLYFGQVLFDLGMALAGLLSQLRQAQGVHFKLVHARLQLGGFGTAERELL